MSNDVSEVRAASIIRAILAEDSELQFEVYGFTARYNKDKDFRKYKT
jgi:hypothetical protein